MKEEFLHYVWQFQNWSDVALHTTNGEPIQVMQAGSINTDAGPDFFNSQIIIDEQRWAGNVEIHIRSSDWYAHKHHQDKRYNAVILHVSLSKYYDLIFKNSNLGFRGGFEVLGGVKKTFSH